MVETAVDERADVTCDVVLEPAGTQVTVRGRVGARWTAPCRRCAEPIAGEIDAGVLEVFEPDPVEGETWPLGSEEIDLAPMVREVVMLELPFAPEGSVDGSGTCLHCGRAVGDDGPDPTGAEPAEPPGPQPDPRWAALDDWSPDTQETGEQG